eukprot:TRINITY_DN1503_c0_g1_i1.p2 TRINITY_DN1503_c0_g1~~TRINITY_DN1503_c0_g1_i1.p2  ORF type:complete len:322 (+),score=47.30 TRINITY_DN1503_c0_g1_i1:110-967(+)
MNHGNFSLRDTEQPKPQESSNNLLQPEDSEMLQETKLEIHHKKSQTETKLKPKEKENVFRGNSALGVYYDLAGSKGTNCPVKLIIAIAGALRTLQESNKKLLQENTTLKNDLREITQKVQATEQKYKKDKEKWQKELLETLSQSSQREQQLKVSADSKQKEVLDLKDSLNKLETTTTKLKNEIKGGELQLANCKKKLEQVTRELGIAKENNEKCMKRERDSELEALDKLAKAEKEKDKIIEEYEKVIWQFQKNNREWRKRGQNGKGQDTLFRRTLQKKQMSRKNT